MNWEHKLREVAARWKASLLEVGKVLVAAEKAGQPVNLWIRAVLPQEFGMPQATARVAMRWARGDLGAEENARLLVDRVPHTTLSKLPTPFLPNVVTGKHRILSRNENRVVDKSLHEMTRTEISDNLTEKGWKPVNAQIDKPPAIRSCEASDFEVDKNGRFILISKGRETSYMIVPHKLLRRMMKAIEEAA